ncbi:MAG: undecaprenyl/decaprenyl-phosphate alpha-N-acetylglucosaminyl 1-phosphate transferase [Bacteroidia bacterium]|nr:undecaprenyl/decaprenyl-phosphate alpha-N-acetylglucosaminyl 1-phosphate transferase [Bacteroidia bacterium]
MQSVLLLLGAFGFSWMLNQILLRYSHNFGVESRQNQDNLVRWSSTIKPTTGGISFYITFLIGALVLLVLMPVELGSSSRMLALILSGTMAFMVGFADDAYGTHPGLKFMGQVLCGVILVSFGIHIDFFGLTNPNLVILDYVLTIFWVVGLMNSLNMLDNMDAVTTTIATTLVMSSMIMLISREGLSEMFYILVVIVGGFMGFLMWNWRPAKIYMGDTGSMFIGLVVAFLGIIYFWNIPASPDNVSHIRKLTIPLMVFIVPIMDTTFVTFARLARGSSPFVGGKDHLTHQLVRIGVAEQMVPVTLGVVSLISGFLAFFAYRLIPEWSTLHSALFTAYPIAVFLLFTLLYRKGAKIAEMKEKIARPEDAPLKQEKITVESEVLAR